MERDLRTSLRRQEAAEKWAIASPHSERASHKSCLSLKVPKQCCSILFIKYLYQKRKILGMDSPSPHIYVFVFIFVNYICVLLY